jgi:hypothetical protein
MVNHVLAIFVVEKTLLEDEVEWGVIFANRKTKNIISIIRIGITPYLRASSNPNL